MLRRISAQSACSVCVHWECYCYLLSTKSDEIVTALEYLLARLGGGHERNHQGQTSGQSLDKVRGTKAAVIPAGAGDSGRKHPCPFGPRVRV